MQITAKDGLGLVSSSTLIIDITDVNDNAPVTFIKSLTNPMPEDTPPGTETLRKSPSDFADVFGASHDSLESYSAYVTEITNLAPLYVPFLLETPTGDKTVQ
ncbi:hypothetical protein FQN60_010585 [Etheostoma spectabile]|uniref:Cadherin domain-containing protein n=1 Tax=Etheostoma spectabile TaxID=54343 RepID=A0A5J5CBC4_9PERO|nr:hypothetical protein FQN60_010585 [Etheostoma spectabile]